MQQIAGVGMSLEASKYSDGALRKLEDLRWRREVIQGWIDCSGASTESQVQLQEKLNQVNSELRVLETVDTVHEGDPNLKQAG
jgi:hypothetical protein